MDLHIKLACSTAPSELPQWSSNQFKQSCNPQLSSRLLQLPSELLWKTLRYLLKYGRPLMSDDAAVQANCNPNDQGKYKSVYQLSAQVLACCQGLYESGQSILYTENILHLGVFKCSGNAIYKIFNTAVPARYDQTQRLEAHTLLSLAQLHQVKPLLTPWYILLRKSQAADIGCFVHFYTQINKIQHVRLDIHCLPCRGLTMLLMLRDFLYDKHIVVSLAPAVMQAWPVGPSQGPTVWTWHVWRLIRCRSIEFEGVAAEDEDYSRQLSDFITSKVAVIDLYELLRDLYQLWNTLLNGDPSSLPEKTLPPEISAMIDLAAVSGDAAEFQALATPWLQEVAKWVRALTQYRVTNATDENGKLTASVEGTDLLDRVTALGQKMSTYCTSHLDSTQSNRQTELSM